MNCSDLGRALEMARRIAARTGHPVPQDPRLRERGLAVLNASWSQFDYHAGAFRLVTWGT